MVLEAARALRQAAKEHRTTKVATTVNIAAISTGDPNTVKIVTDDTAVIVKWSCKAMRLVYKTAEQ